MKLISLLSGISNTSLVCILNSGNNHEKTSSFALCVYFAIVVTSVILLSQLLVKLNTLLRFVVGLLVLIGLGSFIPVSSRLELFQRLIGNLEGGLSLTVVKLRWPDPLYPLLQQIWQFTQLYQGIADLWEGWMASGSKCPPGGAKSTGVGVTWFQETTTLQYPNG